MVVVCCCALCELSQLTYGIFFFAYFLFTVLHTHFSTTNEDCHQHSTWWVYLSKPAIELYCRYMKEADPASEIMESAAKKYFRVPDRADPTLVRVVEEMGSGASGSHSLLKVVEIPDDVKWTIEDYDGVEWVEEVHRTWD